MDWNNGTIFRTFINSGSQTTVDCKVDIAQQDLNNKVFIGVENFVLKPNVYTGDLATYWEELKYVQLESVQLTPYIDYTSQNSGLDEVNQQESRNTSMFARFPLIATYAINNDPTYAIDRVLNKDSILYEMRNNPMALSNGRLRFRMLDETGQELGQSLREAGDLDAGISPILSFAFTLVVYKPDNSYN
tara:strand:- start:1561 stop:2127 length:567 start_codon:yes stop_codon:yes gene_type:complete